MAGFTLPSYDQTKLSDPQYLLAQKVLADATNGAPAPGAFGAIAKTLQGALGGYMAQQSKAAGVQRDASAAQTVADAIDLGTGKPAETQTYGDGTTIDWNEQKANPDLMVKTMMANPDTASVGLDMMGRQMDTKQAAQAKLQEMMMKAYEPMTPYQRMKLGSENLSDAQGNIIPKYDQSAIARMGATGMPTTMPPGVGQPGMPAAQPQGGMPPQGGNLPASAFGGGLLPPPDGRAAPAMGSAPPGAPMPGVMPQTPAQPVPGGIGTAMPSSPKGQLAGQEQAAKNVANKAVPDTDAVAGLTNTLAMAAQLKDLNNTAPDGMFKGPATQKFAQAFGDSSLTPAQQQGNVAFTQFDKTAKTLAAEAVKPLFGSAQLSDADRNAAAEVASVMATGSRAQRAAAIETMIPILQRKRDLAAAEQQAGLEGRAFGPNDVAQIYAKNGIDYTTGQKLNAAPAAAQAAQPASEADYNKLPSGTRFTAPDGTQRVKP